MGTGKMVKPLACAAAAAMRMSLHLVYRSLQVFSQGGKEMM
jgi:hypothetical protein